MKRGVLLLALCGSVLLSGCAAMLERSHVSSTAHADYAVVEDEFVRAETYQGLVNSLLYFIREHSEGGAIRLYNYTGDVEADLASAKAEVLEQDPIGAYAVDTLDCDSTRILTYYEVAVRISYSHTAQEVEDVKPLASVSALRKELDRMAAERQDSGTFLVSYFSGDASLVDTLLWHSICNTPELYSFPAGPGEGEYYDIALYPETGTRRIVEVSVDWRTDGEEVRRQTRETERAAAAFLEANPPEGEAYTPTELAGLLLAEAGLPDRHGTSIPLEVLNGSAPNSAGFLLTAEYLCHYCGIEAFYVLGEPPRPDLSHWLIVSTPEGCRHMTLEPSDGEEEEPEQEPFRLYTDQEMLELGYEWNTALYPACVGEPSDSPPEEGETEPVPAETEEA